MRRNRELAYAYPVVFLGGKIGTRPSMARSRLTDWCIRNSKVLCLMLFIIEITLSRRSATRLAKTKVQTATTVPCSIPNPPQPRNFMLTITDSIAACKINLAYRRALYSIFWPTGKNTRDCSCLSVNDWIVVAGRR